jgi:hypothetical protein
LTAPELTTKSAARYPPGHADPLIDCTYEFFRQYHGRLRFAKGELPLSAAAAGVLHSTLEMMEDGATHIGVTTDHAIESFRNDLFPGIRGRRHRPGPLRWFHTLEEAVTAMGVPIWLMVELEADDGLA